MRWNRGREGRERGRKGTECELESEKETESEGERFKINFERARQQVESGKLTFLRLV